eukprot:1147943-Pelagomonas_calceolata.AAC.2
MELFISLSASISFPPLLLTELITGPYKETHIGTHAASACQWPPGLQAWCGFVRAAALLSGCM